MADPRLAKDGASSATNTRQETGAASLWSDVRFWQALVAVQCLVWMAFAIALGVSAHGRRGGVESGKEQYNMADQHEESSPEKDTEPKPCPIGVISEPVDEDDPSIYDDLTPKEHQAVRDYLLAQSMLELVSWEDATLHDSYIYAMELHVPNKAEALRFLDRGGPRPDRQALVIVYGGSRVAPTVEEYVVGPLPNPTRHTRYAPPGRKNPIPWTSRAPDLKEYMALRQTVGTALSVVHNILNTRRPAVTAAERGRPGSELSGTCPVNHESRNTSQWMIDRVFYNEQYFDSLDEFVRRYNDGTLQKTRLPDYSDEGTDGVLFSSLLRRGPEQPQVPLRAPELLEPDGRRYKTRGRHVEYMGWSFDWRLGITQGLQLYDVRVNGERIVYELSSMEAAAIYSGHDPKMLRSFFTDSGWSQGRSYELVHGVDCPNTALFFDALHHRDTAGPRRFKNAVCVFEMNSGIPLRRHFDSDYAGGYDFYGGMVDHALVLRHIFTIGNYDYIYDYIFHQNGVLEVSVTLTGYLQATFYTPAEAPYGYPAWANQVGNLHQHGFSFKVDIDVLGTENRFETVDIVLENITNPERPDLRHIQTRLQRSLKTTEQEAGIQYRFDQPKYYNFYNNLERNRFGVHRGYRLQVNGIAKTLLPRDDWPPMRGVGWMDYQLAVTRRKESEPSSSSIYNQNDLYDPVVDFQSYISDNETIVDRDLVAWVMLGAHHIPDTSDYPTTTTTGNHLKFFLRPFNYFDEDPSMGSSNAVYITPKDNFHSANVNRFGTEKEKLRGKSHLVTQSEEDQSDWSKAVAWHMVELEVVSSAVSFGPMGTDLCIDIVLTVSTIPSVTPLLQVLRPHTGLLKSFILYCGLLAPE
ncbi:amine oxidase [Branchiostoma belcheri]|nr:amine oxidase [Branchiostoma belcheri]